LTSFQASPLARLARFRSCEAALFPPPFHLLVDARTALFFSCARFCPPRLSFDAHLETPWFLL